MKVNVLLFMQLSLLLSIHGGAVELGEPSILLQTHDDIRFSFNTRGTLAVDSQGAVHVVYYIPDEQSNPPDNQVWYLSASDKQVSSPSRVDSGPLGGGRHPSLAIDKQDTVHVAWQDYRHATEPGRFIDNLEIYYDRKPTGGAFSDRDIRITQTNAGHRGDNGFVPTIAIGSDSRVNISWYDFTRNGSNADIYLRSGSGNDPFPLQQGIEAFRISPIPEDSNDFTSNWLPDVAPLPDGSVYVVWGKSSTFSGNFEVQGRQVFPDGTRLPMETITQEGGRFLDPVRLASDSQGNLGLVVVVLEDSLYQIKFMYKPAQGNWSAPLLISDPAFDSEQASLAFTSEGVPWVVWQEDLGDLHRIRLTEIDVEHHAVQQSIMLSDERYDALTPSIAIHPHNDQLSVVWIEQRDEEENVLILRQGKRTAVSSWRMY